MMTRRHIIPFLAMFTLAAAAVESTNRLHFPVAGFSIAPFEGALGQVPVEGSADPRWVPLLMCLPADDEARANVVVTRYQESFEDYVAMDLRKSKASGQELIRQTPLGKAAVLLEYAGKVQGLSTHYYHRLEKSGDKVFVLTAGATEQQWVKQAAELRACVNSFRCEPAAPAGPKTSNRLYFPAAGFSIAPLEGSGEQARYMPLAMGMPPDGGVTANVNVVLGHEPGTLEDYIAMELDKSKAAGHRLIQQTRRGKSVVILEFAAEMQGWPVHFYHRVETAGGKLFVVTASTTEGQWAKQASVLKACVDSFRCEPAADESQPARAVPISPPAAAGKKSQEKGSSL